MYTSTNNYGGDDFDVFSVKVSPENEEQLHLINSFITVYFATRKIDNLESAIGLAEKVACREKGIVPLLDMLKKAIVRLTTVEESYTDDSQGQESGYLRISPGSLESVGIIQQLYKAFKTENDLECLDNAIEMAQELALEDQGITPLLDRMLEARNRQGIDPKTSGKRDSPQDRSAANMRSQDQSSDDVLRLNAHHVEYVAEIWRCRKSFVETNEIQYLDKAISAGKELVASVSSSTQLHNWRSILQELLLVRFQTTNRDDDLEMMIRLLEDDLVAIPSSHPHRAKLSYRHACDYFERFQRQGDIDDIQKAIKWAEEGVTERSDPDRLKMSITVGHMFYRRYRVLGDVEDLQIALKWAQEVFEWTLPGDDLKIAALSVLTMVLWDRYKELGAIEDLDQATKCAEEAISITPSSNPERQTLSVNLSCLLSERYFASGSIDDLHQSIKLVEEVPPIGNHGQQCIAVVGLLSMYQRHGDLDDLQSAIRIAEDQVAAGPNIHYHRAIYMNLLCALLGMRYNHLGDEHDLYNAIKWAEQGISSCSVGNPTLRALWQNIGMLLERKYKLSGNLADLDRSIKFYEDSIKAVTSDHSSRASTLMHLARSMKSKYDQTESVHDFNRLLQIMYESSYSLLSPASDRVYAARGAAFMLSSKGRYQEATSILELAVRILHKISPRSLGRDDQEYHLSSNTLIASTLVATAFQAGEEATYCVRMLELGRGIIMGLVIDCRSDLQDLQSKYPKAFKKYNFLRLQIDTPLPRMEIENDDFAAQRARREREKMIEELGVVLTSIRSLPGFEGFQLPPRSGDLMELATEGPIVIFNSTRLRSDAIIVTGTSIRSLALPGLTYSSVVEKMNQIPELVRGRRNSYKRRNVEMEALLLWLWDVAVEPVLDFLQLSGGIKRIWWIGVGLLATAPFHAAGDHSPGSKCNTISRAISSYTPSIKALSYAREKNLELLRHEAGSQLLLINMPTTPNNGPLRNTTTEIEEIIDIVKDGVCTTRLDYPSAAKVLQELPSYHAVHFACHGVSNTMKPSESHLLLQSGSAVDKLTVESISNTNIRQAQIAYLSACSTAQNSSKNLADESIYIASAFQLAGFSHVLATQWVSNDEACQQVASDFYRELFRKGGSQGHDRVSAAFHSAVKRLRDENRRQPLLWAPFIHNGA